MPKQDAGLSVNRDGRIKLEIGGADVASAVIGDKTDKGEAQASAARSRGGPSTPRPVTAKMEIGATKTLSLDEAKAQASEAIEKSAPNNTFTSSSREKAVTEKVTQLIKAGGSAEAAELLKQAMASPDQRPGTMEAIRKGFEAAGSKELFNATAKEGVVAYLKGSEVNGKGYLQSGYDEAGFSISRLADRGKALGLSKAEMGQAVAKYIADLEASSSAGDSAVQARTGQLVKKFDVTNAQLAQGREALKSGGVAVAAAPDKPAQTMAPPVETRQQIENRIGDIVKDRSLSTEEKFARLDRIAKDELHIGVDGQKMRDILGRQYERVGKEMTAGLDTDREYNKAFLAEQKAFHDKYKNGIFGFSENEGLIAVAEKADSKFKEQDVAIAAESKRSEAARIAAQHEAEEAARVAQTQADLKAREELLTLKGHEAGEIMLNRDMTAEQKVEALRAIGKELGMNTENRNGFDSEFRRFLGKQLSAREDDMVAMAGADRGYAEKMEKDLEAVRTAFKANLGFSEIADSREKLAKVTEGYKESDTALAKANEKAAEEAKIAADRVAAELALKEKAEREKVLVGSVGDIIANPEMNAQEKVEALRKIGRELGMDPSDTLGLDSRFRRMLGEQLLGKEGEILEDMRDDRKYAAKMAVDLAAIKSAFRAVGGFTEIASTLDKVSGVQEEYKKQDAIAARQGGVEKVKSAILTDRDDVDIETQLKATDKYAAKLGLSPEEKRQAAVAAVQELTAELKPGKPMTPEQFLDLEKAREIVKHFGLESQKEVKVALGAFRSRSRVGKSEMAGAGAPSDE